MRTSFWNVFKVNADNSIEPLRRVRIGGVQMGPGVKFGPGVSFSGIDISKYIGRDMETDESGDVTVIRGFY